MLRCGHLPSRFFVGAYTSKYPGDAPALMKYVEVVRDLTARKAIGVIMTLSSGFYVPPKQMKCHWALLTGNYGFGHRIMAIPLKQNPKLSVSPVSLFPRGFAGCFTRDMFAWNAILSIVVLRVE